MASKHYLQLTDEHFERAISAKVAYGVACANRELTESDKPIKAKNPAKTGVLRGSADDFAPQRGQRMGDEGLETIWQNAGETAYFESGGLAGGLAAPDLDLQTIFNAWATPDQSTRRAIVALVQSSLKEHVQPLE